MNIRKRTLPAILSVALLALLFLFNFSWAAEKGRRCLKGLEFFTGFSQAKLHGKGNYRAVPLMVDFDFDLKPLAKKLGVGTAGLLQFQLEPFISPVYEPDANVEIGNSFMLKVGILPETAKFQAYLKGGLGMVYMTQHTREQSTQFNFTECAGMGMHYFFNKNSAFTLEGRFRHLSNSGTKHPNHGINTYFTLIGIMYQF